MAATRDGSTAGDSLVHSDGTETAYGAEPEVPPTPVQANGDDDGPTINICEICGKDYEEQAEIEAKGACSDYCREFKKMSSIRSPLGSPFK